MRVRLDKKATSISLLVALGVRSDGQKVLLAIKNMGGESEAAWRALLDNLVARGLKTPELVIVDGSSGLDKALAALWSDVPVQRCTVHIYENPTHRISCAEAPSCVRHVLSKSLLVGFARGIAFITRGLARSLIRDNARGEHGHRGPLGSHFGGLGFLGRDPLAF